MTENKHTPIEDKNSTFIYPDRLAILFLVNTFQDREIEISIRLDAAKELLQHSRHPSGGGLGPID